MNFEFEINGYNVYSDETFLVTSIDEVRLTWWERLTSKPWRPLKKSYSVTFKHPDPKVYMFEGNKIVGHPATIQDMSRAIIEKINSSKQSDS